MRVTRTTLAVAAAAMAGAALVAAGPATAANSTGTGVVVGHGTISPGLTNTPTSQRISFTGTLAAAGNPASGTGTYNCNFTGNSSIKETTQKGKGSAVGSCSGAKGTVTSTVAYTRTAGAVQLKGTASGAIKGAITGACVFEPTTAPQIKAYQLQCDLVIK